MTHSGHLRTATAQDSAALLRLWGLLFDEDADRGSWRSHAAERFARLVDDRDDAPMTEHRGHGYGTALVRDVLSWARSIDSDRIVLSATAEGQRLYDKLGFTLTAAPRMKFTL